METQLTKKDLWRYGGKCIRLPSADPVTSHLLKIGYNAGVYGWNWSAYRVPGWLGVVIEGYRSFPSWAVRANPEEVERIHKADAGEPLADVLDEIMVAHGYKGID